MAYTYDPHPWSTKEAITKSKMQHIEDGIKGAADQANANETALNNLQTTSSAEDVALWNALGYSKEILKNITIQQAIQNLQDQIGDSNMKQDLAALKTEVENAREQGYADLRATLQHIRDNVNTVTTTANRADGTASALETAINNARGTYATLKDRIDAIVSANDEAHRGFSTDITTIANTLSAPVDGSTKSAKELFTQIVQANRDTTDTLDKRFDAIDDALGNITGDTANTIATRLNNVITEVEAARVSAANGNTTYTNLDARLEADETNIKDIKNEVDAAHRATVNNDTLNNRFSDIETVIDHVQGENDEVPNGLKQRIAAAESAIDTLEETTNGTIAHQISHAATEDDAGGLTERIATIEHQISHEVVENDAGGLTQRITTAEGNISTINNALNNKANTVDVNNALAGKVSTETMNAALASKVNINDMNNALANKVSVDDMNNALAAKANTNDVNTALDRKADTTVVEQLSQRDTVVINKPDNGSNYTNNMPDLQEEPSDQCDYLIEDDEGKYFYWRYINNNWELISGGGSGESGGGTGNSNAEDYESREAFEEDIKELNKDYYVLEADGIRHHYRYLSTESDSEPIEIGQIVPNINNIKTYDIMVGPENDTNYLYLYGFDYRTGSPIDSTTEPQDVVQNLIRKVPLPAGGGGGGVNTLKVQPITPRSFTMALNSSEKTYLQFFFTTGEANETAHYSLYLDNRLVIPSDELTTILVSGDPANKSSTWPVDQQGNPLAQDKVPAGFYSIDITPYCNSIGNNKDLTLSIALDTNSSITATATWKVSIIQFQLTCQAPENMIIPTTEDVEIAYTPYGNVSKIVHILAGDEEIDTIPLSSAASAQPTSYTIRANTMAHGAHKIDMYMTAEINGKQVPSNHVYREYIWYDVNDTADPIIIACPYSDQEIEIDSYTEVSIPYSVYNKSTEDYIVNYYLNYRKENEKLINSITLNGNNSTTFFYTPETSQETEQQVLTIKVEDVMVNITLKISAIEADVSAVGGAIIDFNPALLTNNSQNRLPTWTTNNKTYGLTVSDNFNWSEDSNGGGYKDIDGKCFVVKAGTEAYLDYKMFTRATGGRSAVFDTGAEMKIIFKVAAVRDASAIWFKNTGKPTANSTKEVGIELGAHSGLLKTDKASDTGTTVEESEYEVWVKGQIYSLNTVVILRGKTSEDADVVYKCIKNYTEEDTTEIDDEQVLVKNASPKKATEYWLKMGELEKKTDATNTYLYFPYSENDKIELDININKHDSTGSSDFIMSYEDGVPSKAYPYVYTDGGDTLYHMENNESTIVIGSPDCDVYIYRLRIYNKSLTTNEILKNFIADGKTIQEKITRYNRNCIYWNEEQGKYQSAAVGYAKLDPIKLAERIPGVKILMLDTPRFTTGKKDFVKGATLRCIEATLNSDGDIVYEDLNNWFFQNGFHAGQGTTSDNYGQSGRNVDFLFMCDGEHAPTKVKNIQGGKTTYSGYVSSVLRGNNASKWDAEKEVWKPAEDAEPEVCTNWKGDSCKIKLTEHSVPNNYFNLKVNIASSENVNNALFQKRYNDFLPYETIATANHNYEEGTEIKNSMEFVPAILFIRENDSTGATTTVEDGVEVKHYPTHTEFDDTKWHFYALGNLGDSKKTDYTRAYDPTDPYEFTIENSDNSTANGQFQSGVYMNNGTETIETNVSTINPIDFIYPISSEQWNAMRQPTAKEAEIHANPSEDDVDVVMSNGMVYTNYRHRALSCEGFDGDHSFEFRYASCGDFRDGDKINDTTGNADAQNLINRAVFEAFYEWVITSTPEQFRDEFVEWAVPSSMEFFYAYTHYYTMMDNRAKNTFWHFAKTGTYRKVSRPVPQLLHIYHELIDGQYIPTEDTTILAPTYYIKDYVLTTDKQFVQDTVYYIKDSNYTQYDVYIPATVTTNQLIPENTYYIFNKYKLTTDEEIKAGIDYYTYLNGNYYLAETNIGDPIKYYYTQYAFDMWAYDMDTAAGIDNNGVFAFSYGKEDTDYRNENDSSSGYAFNGAGSIFWRRLSTTFASQIRDIMTSAHENCFNATHLINEFDAMQNEYPEEIWRLDIERKYIRTFTGKSMDNSITTGKQNSRFLRSMMQGRKKYQRRQWIKDQSIYFGSKYRLSNVIGGDNTIEFNCTLPSGDQEALALPIDLNLQLTPFQDMYINVEVGNGNLRTNMYVKDPNGNYIKNANQQFELVTDGQTGQYSKCPSLRAKAGQDYYIDCYSGNLQETRIFIRGANSMQKIGNLASMYIYSTDFRALEHVKALEIGTDVVGYSNTKLTELNISKTIPLLETLNIKNCRSLAGQLDLSSGNNIKVIEAEGSRIAGIILPQYTAIETLHLPSTIQTLSLYGARRLNDFYIKNIVTNEINYANLTSLTLYDSDYSDTIGVNFDDEKPYEIGDTCLYDGKLYEFINAHEPGEWNSTQVIHKLPVDWMNIAESMLDKADKLLLYKLHSATITDINNLQQFYDKKQTLETSEEERIVFSGIINVTGEWSQIEKNIYKKVWNDLTLDTTNGTKINKVLVNYIDSGYESVPEKTITTIYIKDTDPIPDIYAGLPVSELPTRDPTIAETFSFGSYDENGYIEYSGWTANKSEPRTPLNQQGYSSLNNNPLTPAVGQSTVNLYTYYVSAKHKYTVQWKIDDTVIKEITDQDFGGGYTLKAPTIKDIRKAGISTATVTPNSDGTITYTIFDHWEKLPTNIAPTKEEAKTNTYVIGPVWREVRNIPINNTDTNSLYYDTTTLSADQLLVLSRLSYSTVQSNDNIKNIIPQRKFNYQMGYSGLKQGITLINNNNIRRISGTIAPQYVHNVLDNSNVYPFSINDGFTIAIDYQFGAANNSSLPEVLVGCYDKNNGSVVGFALYRGYTSTSGGAGTFICYGDTPYSSDSTKRIAVGDATHRNIVVLRHEKNSSSLRVYTSQNATSTTSINTTLVETNIIELPTQNLSANAQICIGGLRPNLSSTNFPDEYNNARNAQGTIYWMKYWGEDLGLGECLQLAAWPHENMTAIITAVNNSETDQALIRPRLYLTNLNCSNHAIVTNEYFKVSNGNDVGPYETGWATSNTKAICDNRLLQGLPVELQCIISKPTIGYFNYTSRYTDNGSQIYLSPIKTAPDSYVYVPSISSLDKTYKGVESGNYGYESIYELTGTTNSDTSVITPYTWFETAGTVINAQKFMGSSAETKWVSTTPQSYWFNIRFNEKPIIWSTTNKMNIYLIDSAVIGSETFYSAIGASNIKANDIIIYTSNNEEILEGVYMYVSASELSTYGIQILPQTGFWKTGGTNTVDGGWIKSTPYVTRSVPKASGKSPNYMFITEVGKTVAPVGSNDQAATGSLSLDFAFTI